jgi:class 3 adenylate cyclase
MPGFSASVDVRMESNLPVSSLRLACGANLESPTGAGPIWDRANRETPMTVAIVARKSPRGLQYLAEVAPATRWSTVEQLATRFADVRSATRAALTLAPSNRAFALPTAGPLGPC